MKTCKLRNDSEKQWDAIQALADQNGLSVTMPTAGQWHIHWPEGWLLQVYPGKQRLYWDRHHMGPFIRLPEGIRWTVLDVLRIAIEQTCKS